MVRRFTLPLCWLLLGASLGVAQEEDPLNSFSLTDLIELDDELMNMEITVASGKENKLTARESPGVVTVLTRRDIKATGAARLMDLLRFVPGYDIGSDGNGIDGLIARGNAASEGKVLVNLNGMPANEVAYASFALELDIDHIERIEIIRGPGSALYGGAAELGVINIITRDMRGSGEVAVATDRIADSVGYSSAAFAYGRGTDRSDDWDVNVFAHYREFASTEGLYVPADAGVVSTSFTYANAEEFHQRESIELLLNGSKDAFYFDVLWADNRYGMPINSFDTALAVSRQTIARFQLIVLILLRL